METERAWEGGRAKEDHGIAAPARNFIGCLVGHKLRGAKAGLQNSRLTTIKVVSVILFVDIGC